MAKIFIYGTLKQGFGNHLEMGESQFLYEAQTSAEYSLYLNGYPALVKENSVQGVFGEVYEVPDRLLPHLDDFEDVPDLYQRVTIQVKNLQSMKQEDCETYLLSTSLDSTASKIVSGIFSDANMI